MSFVVVFLLGLALFYLFERKRFLKLDALELATISFGISISFLTFFGFLF